MANSYAMLDMTVYGRHEPWEDSPAGWPQEIPANQGGAQFRAGADGTPATGRTGRPSSQWSRLAAGRDDRLG